MFKLNYPSRSARWPNDLTFSSWYEYWKTLGFLSNPNTHKYYLSNGSIDENDNFDIILKKELNSQSGSHTDTPRFYYYGLIHDESWFSTNFSDLYGIHQPSISSNVAFRINRKEFGETLLNDLNFFTFKFEGERDYYIIPNENNIAFNSASKHHEFNSDAWQEGWNLAK